MSEKNSFLKGAVILGVAGIVVKILGAFFRIPLGNYIGDTGMSYYQSAYPVYNWLLVISTAGLPTAIAKMVSEKNAIDDLDALHKIFKTAFMVMFVIGLISSGMLFIGASTIVNFVKNPKAIYSMRAIAPALFFVSIMSVFRGYFQGLQRMKPYAISQVIEQLFRVIVGLSLAIFFLSQGTEYAAAGATFGASVGGLFGFVVIVIMYLRTRDEIFIDKKPKKFPQLSTKEIIVRLFKIAIPVTLGASVLPIMNLIDLGIVMRRLHSIGMAAQANELYGQLTGYAATLVNLPQVITAAVQISIVPAVSHIMIKEKEKLNHTIENGIRTALLIGLPAAVGLVTLSEGIIGLLYPMQMDLIVSTGRILSVLGWGIAFLSLFQVTTGILQGLGRQTIPAKNLFVGAIIKLILSYVLIGIPQLNILGAALSTVIGFGVAAFLNFYTLKKLVQLDISYYKVFVKPLIVVVLMGIIVKIAYMIGVQLTNSIRLATVIGIFFGVLSYAILLFKTNTITEDDYRFIPGGDKIRDIRKKLRL
jgi:stage V sporulation protein B